jgi:hypothetical protein
VGKTTEQARAQIEATRGRAELTLDRLEARIRLELSPSHRLHRDGAKLAAGLAVALLVGTTYVVRSRRRRRNEPEVVDWIEAMPEEWRERLRELLAEAATSGTLGVPRKAEPKRSVGQALLMRAARMAVPVIITAVADRVARRQSAVDAP